MTKTKRRAYYHKWKPVGREWESPAVNLWRCKHCGVYKALSEPGRGPRDVEYSSPDGEVLRRGALVGPPQCCAKGVNSGND